MSEVRKDALNVVQKEGGCVMSMNLRHAAAAALMIGPMHAQPFPANPVHLVVPLAAGGVGDVIARAVGQRLSETHA